MGAVARTRAIRSSVDRPGSGKTVFVGFMLAMLARQGVTQVVFDKDRGLEILVRALGGTYLPLKNGAPTGFNPLQLPPTPANVEFLKIWLRSLVRASVPLSVREEADLDHALRGTLALELSCATPFAAHRVHRCNAERRRSREALALVRKFPRRLRLGV